jgi:T5SS/PEP-CTERM-associated repeat protein
MSEQLPRVVLLAGLLVLACGGRAFAQSESADWTGGSGVWGDKNNWNCSPGISDNNGHCVPNGSNVDVNIENGSSVVLNLNAATNVLFLDSGSSLTVGGGQTLTNAFQDHIGDVGSASLTISSGGIVNDAITALGLTSLGSATLTVSGQGSQLNASQLIEFAVGGQGTLTISNANDSGNVTVGDAGMGTLTLQNGAVLSNGSDLIVGKQSGANGSVSIEGAGSAWTQTGVMRIGDAGTGTLKIQNEGALTTGSDGSLENLSGVIGVQAGSTGTVTVQGDNSE